MSGARIFVVGVAERSADAVIRAVAARLLAEGHVRPSFPDAAALRERRSPTGLPFPGAAVALPHAEPEHVVSPAVAVAQLAQPVRFGQMGSPEIELEVRLVVMPAFSSKEQAGGELSRWIDLLRDPALREELLAAATPEAMEGSLARRWGG